MSNTKSLLNTNYENANRATLNAARAQIMTAKRKHGWMAAGSGVVCAVAAVGIANGLVNAQYVDVLSQVGAIAPESVIAVAGLVSLIRNGYYNAKLNDKLGKAKPGVDFYIAVDDEIQRRRRP